VNNTWGTGTAPVHIRYATFDLNGLFGVNIIPTTEVPGLSGWEKWGGDLVDVGGTLYLPYSKRTVANASADFYSGVASGASITTLSDVSFDLATANQEGIKYTRVGGVNYWVATQSNGPINVYNFAFTTKLGALTTDFTWTAPPAHPCIIPVNRADGNTEYHLLAFNNDIIFSGASGSYGSFVVAKGSAVNTGREFPTLRGLFGWR